MGALLVGNTRSARSGICELGSREGISRPGVLASSLESSPQSSAERQYARINGYVTLRADVPKFNGMIQVARRNILGQLKYCQLLCWCSPNTKNRDDRRQRRMTKTINSSTGAHWSRCLPDNDQIVQSLRSVVALTMATVTPLRSISRTCALSA